jgi:3-oxoacyl-[acyl-carrier-protein] synthase III
MDEALWPRSNSVPRVGISAISVYEPPWVLGNEWFGETIPRKFVHHTGIEARPVSLEDEVTMGVHAVRALQRETGCDLKDCAAVVLASPSFVPLTVARRLLDPQRAEQERLRRAARQLVRRLGIPECRATGLNWFCSGYSRAMAVACRRIVPRLQLGPQQFVLIVTASRISRITDYGCKQTAGLFGDLATATLLAPADSGKYPAHFEVLHAAAEKQRTETAYFDFHVRQQVPVPRSDGGKEVTGERLVFSLDGMGIADIAPRAMAAATLSAVKAVGLCGEDVQFVVPHQAGSGIVRFTATKLETSGVRGEVINGLTKKVGNVSACSIPYALKATWNRLSGVIACPTAAVGSPGAREVSQGCVLLKATPLHERQRQAAA